MTVKTKIVEAGDVFIREDLSRSYDADAIAISNGGAVDWHLPAGTPFTNAVPTVAASINAATSLLLHPVKVPAGEWACGTVIPRGTGVVINGTKLPTKDIAAAADINMTTFKTRLATLGFVVREEATNFELQEK